MLTLEQVVIVGGACKKQTKGVPHLRRGQVYAATGIEWTQDGELNYSRPPSGNVSISNRPNITRKVRARRMSFSPSFPVSTSESN